MAIELPEDYYLSNFKDLIDYIVSQYEDLLSESELSFHRDFTRLTEDAQKLYVRMLTRKGNLFRSSKLQYKEITSTPLAAKDLEDTGLIEINPTLTPEELVALFNKQEWVNLLSGIECVEPAIISELKKSKRNEFDHILCELLATDKIENSIKSNLSDTLQEQLLLVGHPEIFETFKLLFFGNSHQDLTEYVLRDLGLYRFENYVIDKNSRLFTSRKQIDNHLSFYQLVDKLNEVLEEDSDALVAFYQSLPDLANKDSTLNRRIQRTYIKLARQLERLGDTTNALIIYEQCSRPPARERMARIYANNKKWEESLTLCQQILASPSTEEETIFALDFGHRTAKKADKELSKNNTDSFAKSWPKAQPKSPTIETSTLLKEALNVELLVANSLAKLGHCFYVENTLLNSLFGLHYWELLFTPTRGAFTNPFQSRPHDLFDSGFLAARQEEHQRAQSRIEGDIPKTQLIKEYQSTWKLKHGTANPFVFWDSIDEELIDLALTRIPIKHLAAIYQRIWQDLKANRSGLPDLILFPHDGGYELIEVKGPGDRLQKNQIRWMNYFSTHDIPHKVIHVEWA